MIGAGHHKRKLTAHQREYLDYIRGYFAVYETMPPTVVLAREFEVSNHAIYNMLQALESKHILAQSKAGQYIPGPKW